VSACGFTSTLSGSTCVDMASTITSTSSFKQRLFWNWKLFNFLQNINNLYFWEDGKYLVAGLSNSYFGMSEITGMGLSVSGFLGNYGGTDSGAMTSQCS